jgi:hydrogenase-4 component F
LGMKYPIFCICAAVGVLGISGMPPLGIFNSEWMIFSGGFNSGAPIVLAVLTLLGSLFTVFYALRFFGGIFFGGKRPESLPAKAPIALTIPTLAVAVFLLIEGVMPGTLLDWAIKGLATIWGAG